MNALGATAFDEFAQTWHQLEWIIRRLPKSASLWSQLADKN